MNVKDNHIVTANSRQIQQLTPRHYAILDLVILGKNSAQISEQLKMSKTQVNLVLSSPCFKHQAGIQRSLHEEKISDQAVKNLDQTRTELINNTLAAAQALTSGLNSVDDKIKIKSAESILDRTGYPKETKIEGGTNTNIFIDQKNINILKETLDMVNSETQGSQFKNTGSD